MAKYFVSNCLVYVTIFAGIWITLATQERQLKILDQSSTFRLCKAQVLFTSVYFY